MARRLAVYGLASTICALSVVSSAMRSRANFYAAMVSLGKSSASMMVLANFVIFNAICLGIGLKRIFFGQLRTIEHEHLWERLWIFMTESLLAMAIFRDEFSLSFLFMYGVLVFLRCFHWITADRVDYMDQIPPPGPRRGFHIRICTIVSILMVTDFLFVTYSLETLLVEGASAFVIFAAEFLILQASIAGTAAKYTIGMIDLRRARGREDAPPWEAKSMYLFYVDLAVDFVKLLTYLMFFAVILLNYGLPLHILRDVYITLNSFLARIRDLIRYRRATRDMDTRYPDATEEELERNGDRTCIICREEMITRSQRERNSTPADDSGPNETPKKLVCGHIFHFHCLRSWLERQQKCPTCRRDVLRRPVHPPAHLRHLVRPEILAEMAGEAPPQPAPPAPAAAPLNPNTAQPAETARQQFDEFFQQPQSTSNNQPQSNAVPVRSSVASTGTTDLVGQTAQRGIWGGVVTPGRYTPAPLGTAPRFPAHSHLSLGTAYNNAGPSSHIRGRPQLHTSAFYFQNSHGQSSAHNPLSPSSPQIVSGSVTPFHSNPPVVFSSTGTARSVNVPESDENAIRKQSAEAAVKRLGLTGSNATVGSAPSSNDPAHDGKGKGKETAEPEIVVEEWDAPPRVHAVLSSTQKISALYEAPSPPSPLSRDSFGAAVDSLTEGIDKTPEGTRIALEKRLKLLSQVDEKIWDLFGELSRLKSEWEVEDGIPTREPSSSGGSPAGPSGARVE